MIALRSSENYPWPWASQGENAERVFRQTYPGIFAHVNTYRNALQKRQDQGRYWWELRSCAYWDDFDIPKLMHPEITWRASWVLDRHGTLCNNTAYFLPSDDPWILAVANAPITGWYAWRTAMHGKDEALRFIKDFVVRLPIPIPTETQRGSAGELVLRQAEIASCHQTTRRTVLDWLRVEYEIEKPTLKLQSPIELDSDGFVAEIRKIRGIKKPLTAAGLKALRDEYARSIEPARRLAAEAMQLEYEISDLVNEAYGLTPEEITLMWATAPPRMPLPGPRRPAAS